MKRQSLVTFCAVHLSPCQWRASIQAPLTPARAPRVSVTFNSDEMSLRELRALYALVRSKLRDPLPGGDEPPPPRGAESASSGACARPWRAQWPGGRPRLLGKALPRVESQALPEALAFVAYAHDGVAAAPQARPGPPSDCHVLPSPPNGPPTAFLRRTLSEGSCAEEVSDHRH